jgi:hypothetical protein
MDDEYIFGRDVLSGIEPSGFFDDKLLQFFDVNDANNDANNLS